MNLFCKFCLLFCLMFKANAQKLTMLNTHAHNDYLNTNPFHEAFQIGYRSIEVDVFYQNNELYVAHELKQIQLQNTFIKLYLNPILQLCKLGKMRPLQLLVDLKTKDIEIMNLLALQVKPFNQILKKAKVSIVVSGNMPEPSKFSMYHSVFNFDGRKDIKYNQKESKRIVMLSCSRFDFLKNPSQMQYLVDSVHAQHKKMRFWGFGNTVKDYEFQAKLGVDFIGTDSLTLLKKYIEQ